MTSCFYYFISLFLLLCFTFHQCLSNDVVGCNGFVKSIVGDIEFTKVGVKIITKQGTVKDQTECAPNNGYYFLPLYDKGEYILKVAPPTGWHFEPDEVSIAFDGSTDPCSMGSDINFVLQGFAITGQVTSLGDSVGPKGVAVNLRSVGSTSEVLLSTNTLEGGHFILSPVRPGRYNVEVSHKRWHLTKKNVPVTVKNGNVQVPADSLVVSGYDVSGTVTSDGEPIKGVSFVLFQKADAKRITVVDCDSSALTGFSPSGSELSSFIAVCHVASDAKGRFTFVSLPPGQYTVVPYYKGAHSIKFDVQPQHLAFEVKHGSLDLPIKFQVKGFSVDGRVLWSPNGKPLGGASILLDEKVISKTEPDGVFHLDSMTPGIYKLRVQAGDVMFEEQSVKVTPNTPHIGDLVPSAYRVCGRVSVTHSSPADRLVDMVCSDTSDVYQATTDEAGYYCIFLPPATYTVSLPVSDAERGSGLQFAPLKRTIKVLDSPVMNVDFSQLRATVKGTIQCLDKKCPDIAVTLHAQDSTTALAKGGQYMFENVLPGDYTVAVESQDWCWQATEHSLSVSSAKVTGPTFKQTGLTITFVSSHSTQVRYKSESGGSSTLIDIAAGRSQVCVPTSGPYVLEPVGCHGYASPSLRWTPGSGVVTLTAVSHLYTGHILSADTVSDLVVNVIPSDENNTPSSSVRRLGQLRVTVDAAGASNAQFSIKLAPGETVTLMPSGSSLLFTPMSASVVGGEDCVDAGAVFRAERGLIVEGRVVGKNVSVAGAAVSIHNAQGQHIATQITDGDGRYMFGPLSANVKYEVTAEKEGYILAGPDAQGLFNAHKLAEVIVTVIDKADGHPLQGVLLSLSGGENYRRNSQTGADGTMAFLSLSPSEYYLRPMMKEYRFEPPSKMIAVQEGATVKVELSGSRVAYSVLGAVTSLSGDPEPGVVVEARGEGAPQCSQLQEETTTETNGQFRIRGLQPKCEYTVRVKEGPQVNQHIQRSTPEGILVKVTKEDIHGLNIIAFRPISRTDISVYVTAESPDHLRSLRVKMFRDDTTVHTVRLSTLKPTSTFALTSTVLVFPPVPADGRTYSIQLESSLSQNTHNYKTHPVFFKANSSFQAMRLNFVTTAKASDSELSHTSYLTLPLVLLALLVYYNRDGARALARRLMAGTATADTTVYSQDDNATDAILVEQIAIKKKVKQRKT